MAIITVTSKFVEVGAIPSSPGGAFYGFLVGALGDMNEVVNGSLDNTTDNLHATTTTINDCYYNAFTANNVFLFFNGNNVPNSNWTRMVVNGVSYNRTAGNYNGTSGSETRYFWPENTNPFGTTVGADISVDFELDVADTVDNSLSQTSLSANESTTVVATLSNAVTTKYRIIKETGTTPSVGDGGTIDERTDNGTINIPTSGLPTAGNTATYQVQVGAPHSQTTDDECWEDATGTNNSFTITRSAASSSPVISSVTDNNEASASVAITVNLSNNGSGGDGLFYGKGTTTNENSVTNWKTVNTFRQTRNTTRYYFASRSSQASSSHTLVSGPTTKFVGYIAPDTGVTISPAAQSRSSGGTASWTLSGTTANHFYQLEDAGGNQMASGSATGTSLVLTASAASAAAWPNEGDTVVLEGLVKLETSRGGDGNFDNIPTTSVSANLTVQNLVPAQFFFSDVTSASVGQIYYTYVQITGTGGAGQTASILSGTASTAVSSSITQPSDASFTAANKTINENQYLHVKKQASSSSAIQVSAEIQVGQVSDTWSITTSAGSGDYGVIVYDDGANKVWSSAEPTKTVRNLDQFTVTLYPPNVGSNSAIVALEGVQSQADLEANYILQSAGGSAFGLFSGASDPSVAFESTGFIKCTWAGVCIDIFGQSRPCESSDATTTTFYPLVIGKDIE